MEIMRKLLNAKNGAVAIVEYDAYAESPRESGQELFNFYTFESRYGSPDKHFYKGLRECVADLVGEVFEERMYNKNNSGTAYMADIVAKMDKFGYVALPVWKYEHSVTVYKASMYNPFHCPWDSGMVGIIFGEKKKICDMYGWKKITKARRAIVHEYMKSDADVWTMYSNGEVFRVGVRAAGEEDDDAEFVDNIFADMYDNEVLTPYVNDYFGNTTNDWVDHTEELEEEFLQYGKINLMVDKVSN